MDATKVADQKLKPMPLYPSDFLMGDPIRDYERPLVWIDVRKFQQFAANLSHEEVGRLFQRIFYEARVGNGDFLAQLPFVVEGGADA